MDKKVLLKIVISVFFILLIGTISWQVFIIPNKEDLMITKVEAAEIVENRYQGEVTNAEEIKEAFIITIKSDTGEYEITISSKSGEVQGIVQTKTESPSSLLSEDEVEQIALSEVPGQIEMIKKTTEDGVDYYDAIVKSDKIKVSLKINAKSGEIIDKEEHSITVIEDDRNKQKDSAEQEKKQERPRNISEQDAIQIALNTVYGEVDDVDLESLNGQLYYFIEIERDDDLEAKIQIHAITGEVISIEWDD